MTTPPLPPPAYSFGSDGGSDVSQSAADEPPARKLAVVQKQRLEDALRFGPMTMYMRGWSEEDRRSLVERVALDLLGVGYTLTLCHNGHTFRSGLDVDEMRLPSPLWCDQCGEARREQIAPLYRLQQADTAAGVES